MLPLLEELEELDELPELLLELLEELEELELELLLEELDEVELELLELLEELEELEELELLLDEDLEPELLLVSVLLEPDDPLDDEDDAEPLARQTPCVQVRLAELQGRPSHVEAALLPAGGGPQQGSFRDPQVSLPVVPPSAPVPPPQALNVAARPRSRYQRRATTGERIGTSAKGRHDRQFGPSPQGCEGRISASMSGASGMAAPGQRCQGLRRPNAEGLS